MFITLLLYVVFCNVVRNMELKLECLLLLQVIDTLDNL